MTNKLPEEASPSNIPKSTLSVWLSAILVNLTLLIPNETQRQIALTLCPPAGYAGAKLCRIIFQEVQHQRACKIIEANIKHIEKEINAIGTTKGRKATLVKKVDELREALQQKRLSNVEIKTESK